MIQLQDKSNSSLSFSFKHQILLESLKAILGLETEFLDFIAAKK